MRLGNNRFALLRLCLLGSARFCRKLQYGCLLAFIQTSEQHSLTVRKFKGIVMGVLVAPVYLPEDCSRMRRWLFEPHLNQRPDCPLLVSYCLREGQLSAREHTDGRAKVSRRSKAACSSAEVGRDELVADFRWARAHIT